MRAVAVIGAGWGDEGKGAAVDALAAATPNPLVIRHNGGAQAGHSVVSPQGARHVFSHFCSGALAGAPGHLSEHFVINQRIFCVERRELAALEGANLSLTVDPDALVTTPLDVAINRALERSRGATRHGSVGVGFGETIERSERGYALRAKDLVPGELTDKLTRIIRDWAPRRWAELGLVLESQHVDWAEFYDDVREFTDNVELARLEALATQHSLLIFEGAQGLLLDQRRGMTFPHVTRSNTGLQNALPLAMRCGVREFSAIYMMRPYMTRHGVGVLPGEAPLGGIDLVDPTNKPGEWQGFLRTAPFNAELIKRAIGWNLGESTEYMAVRPYIGLSCIDQIEGAGQRAAWPAKAAGLIGLAPAVMGHGPRRGDYTLCDEFSGARRAA